MKSKVQNLFLLTVLNKALPEIFLCLSFFGTLEGQRHDITILDHIREVKYQRASSRLPVQDGHGETDPKTTKRHSGIPIRDIVAMIQKAVADIKSCSEKPFGIK